MEDFNIRKIFREENLPNGRMICESKSMYRDVYPDNIVVFNANIVTVTNGKVWFGDLDLTRDAEALRTVSKNIGEPLFILREMDGRFENENLAPSDLIKKAIWNTSEEIPVKI